MTMYLSLPNDYILSQFNIICFSIYFVLRNFDSANFCGLNYYGGPPAIAPPGIEVTNNAYYLTFISYLPEMMGDGLGHVVVGAMPMCKDPVLGDAVHRVSHITFMVRMFLLIIFLHNQLPGFHDVHINSHLSAFSFTTDNITCKTVRLWVDGPEYRPSDPGSPGSPPQNAANETASNGSNLVSRNQRDGGIGYEMPN
ncbi:hypothetical protein K438DRAFT_1758133 [Mycena galopus ATCC 62051]|nr:hypothetical protein K438DRAFT_1758133 [Mycena galopus ATCC 62051]